MTSQPRRRLVALSRQLVQGIPDAGTFSHTDGATGETVTIPKIRNLVLDDEGGRGEKTETETGEGEGRGRVRGKVCIVTGANSPLGIGRAAVHLYARHGARAIYLCDYATDFFSTHVAELSSLYPDVKVHTFQLDVGDEERVKLVCDEAVSTYGRLDIMFANAGVVGAMTPSFQDVSADEFMNTMRVNALGVFLCAKYAALAMQKTNGEKEFSAGSIVCTASVAGIRSNAGGTDYSASKAAVVSIAQTMSYQLSGTGVRVNAICPGLIETGMTKLVYDAARERGTEKKIGQLNPLRRGGIADEIARVALFLGSDESSYVNGQAWAVCGGLTAGHPYVPGKLA